MHQVQQTGDLEAAPDGFTYFGSLPEVFDEENDDLMPSHDNPGQNKGIVVNDFVIPSRTQQSAE